MRRVLPWMAAALAFLALLVTTPPPRDAFAALFATTTVPSGRAEPAPSSAPASTALEGTAEAQPRRGEAAPFANKWGCSTSGKRAAASPDRRTATTGRSWPRRILAAGSSAGSVTRGAGGRLVGEDTFDGRHLRYRNDPCARPVRIVDERKHATELTYDLAGQLVERTGWSGAKDEFSYSLLGELVAAKSSSAEVTFERDALGRIVQETQEAAGEEHTVGVPSASSSP